MNSRIARGNLACLRELLSGSLAVPGSRESDPQVHEGSWTVRIQRDHLAEIFGGLRDSTRVHGLSTAHPQRSLALFQQLQVIGKRIRKLRLICSLSQQVSLSVWKIT